MGKTKVEDFNRAVCTGAHPDVDGPCEHRVAKDADTGQEVVDTLARLEAGFLERVTQKEQFKCGKCGCPLANLGATNFAPEDCPRLDLHDG